MPVSIVIEDGSGVVNANSWVSLSDTRAYANDRGVTLPADDDALGAMVVQAGDFLNSFRGRYAGTQTYRGLPMVWPRYDAYIEGEAIPDNEIPALLIQAQYEAVIAVSRGVILLPTYAGGDLPVIRDKVGPLDTEYADPYQAGGVYADWRAPSIPAVDALLAPLFKAMAGLRTRRI